MDEPPPLRGAIFHPGAGYHSYPPPTRRFEPPRRTCPRCGLPADTWSPTCPVCATRYEPTLRERLRRALRRLRLSRLRA